jgi:hypothetical protein
MVKGFLKDLKVNEGFMAQIFSNMMDDRDIFEAEEWVERYNSFITLVVDKLFEMKGVEMTKDERIEYLALFSHSIYTKEYDEGINSMGDTAEA